MKIITITLNPAFDIHGVCKNFRPFHENLTEITSKDIGGKGINISRALSDNGIENTALVVLGRENANDFKAALSLSKLKTEEIILEGRIRENITIHSSNAPETRISFKGFEADSSLLFKIKSIICDKVDADTVIAFAGSVPTGVSLEDVKEMLSEFKKSGAKIVIDSKSFKMQDLIDCAPWLIKPNDEEIFEYAGREPKNLEDAAKEAEKIRIRGIENVMISLGAKGAVLACSDGCFIAEAPSVSAISTIGAGDSSIAGFLAATQKGLSAKDVLKTAVSYGSAACLTEGTKPPRKDDIEALLKKTIVKQIRITRIEL